MVALGYEDGYRAGDHVPDVLQFQPLAVEGMNDILYHYVTKKHLPVERYLSLLPDGKGWLSVELGSNDPSEVEQRARRMLDALRRASQPPKDLKLIASCLHRTLCCGWPLYEYGLLNQRA